MHQQHKLAYSTEAADLLDQATKHYKQGTAYQHKHHYIALKNIADRGPLPEHIEPPAPGQFYSMEHWLTGCNNSNALVNAMVIYQKLGWEHKERVRLLLTGNDECSNEELLQAMQFDESHALNVCIRHLVADNLFPFYAQHDSWVQQAGIEWMKCFMPNEYQQEKNAHDKAITIFTEKFENCMEAISKMDKNAEVFRLEKEIKNFSSILDCAKNALQNELSENT